MNSLWKIYKQFPYFEYRHRIVAHLPHQASLLEIGSSTCEFARLFKFMRPDIQVYAVDIEDFSRSAGDSITFAVADITKGLPKDFENRFDCVTTMHLFEHLDPKNYDTAVCEIRRVLKPGGVWYIETPGLRSLFFPSFSFGRHRYSCPMNFYDDPSHVKVFTEGGLFYLMKNNGFIVKRTGVARNWLFTFCAPILVLAGFLTGKRLWVAVGLFNLFGWAVFGHGTSTKEITPMSNEHKQPKDDI